MGNFPYPAILLSCYFFFFAGILDAFEPEVLDIPLFNFLSKSLARYFFCAHLKNILHEFEKALTST